MKKLFYLSLALLFVTFNSAKAVTPIPWIMPQHGWYQYYDATEDRYFSGGVNTYTWPDDNEAIVPWLAWGQPVQNDWFEYTYCDSTDEIGDSIWEALGVLQNQTDLPLVGILVNPLTCYMDFESYEIFTKQGPGFLYPNKRIPNPDIVHPWIVMGSYSDPSADYARSLHMAFNPTATEAEAQDNLESFKASTNPYAVRTKQVNGNFIQKESWFIIINYAKPNAHYDTIKPSLTTNYGNTSIKWSYFPEIVLHEFMHVLGGDHVKEDTGPGSWDGTTGNGYSTSLTDGVYYSLGGKGLTAFDRTFDHPSPGATGGEFYIPSMDLAFIDIHYPNLSTVTDEPHIVPWVSVFYDGLSQDYEFSANWTTDTVAGQDPMAPPMSPAIGDLVGCPNISDRDGSPITIESGDGLLMKGWGIPGSSNFTNPGDWGALNLENMIDIMPTVSYYIPVGGPTFGAEDFDLILVDPLTDEVVGWSINAIAPWARFSGGDKLFQGLRARFEPSLYNLYHEGFVYLNVVTPLELPYSNRYTNQFEVYVALHSDWDKRVRVHWNAERPRECATIPNPIDPSGPDVIDPNSMPCCEVIEEI